MSRLVVRTYTYVCNGPGCPAAIEGLTGRCEENSARAAWAEAGAEGWSAGQGDDMHYCPDHGRSDYPATGRAPRNAYQPPLAMP